MKKTSHPPAPASNAEVQPSRRRRRALNGRGPAPLALEPRVMFDGATGDAVLAARSAAEHMAAAQFAQRSVDADSSGIGRLLQAAPAVAVETPAQRHEIVFVEDNIDNYEQLVAGVKPGLEVVMLDHTKDGLQQMLAALDGHVPVDAIHLVTHGGPAEINLGSANVELGNLDTFGEQFARLGSALAAGGDFLIYGCDVAAGVEGQQFVARLASITGADVAASTDSTGSAAAGGDWDLESHVGLVDAQPLRIAQYDGTLKVSSITAPIAVDGVVSSSEAQTLQIKGITSNQGQDVFILIVDSANNQVTGTATTSGGTAWTSGNIDVSGLLDGTLTVYAKQGSAPTTATGGSDARETVAKDTVGPVVTAGGGSVTSGVASFTLSATDAGGVARYEYQVDGTGGTWVQYAYASGTSTMTLSTSGLSAGAHQLYVRGVDSYGNTTAAPSQVGFTVAGAPASHAPVASGDAVLPSIAEGNTNGPGASVSALFASHFSDADGDTLAGIAIVSYTRNTSMGEWQYNSGAGWNTITSTASDAAAITFKSSDQLRFVPASGYTGGAPALAVRLIDSKATVTTNGVVNTAGGGGSSDYSGTTINLNNAVKPSYSLASPDSKFVTLLSGNNYDPVNDTQSHAADTDLVGNANAPLLIGGYDSNTGDLYYRVRIGNPTLSKGVPVFTGVVLLGVDVDNDGKLDVFIAVDGRNNGMGVATFAPGSDLNISPSTTSLTAEQAIGANAKTSYTYAATGGDIGSDGKPDAYLTFTLPFSVLQARLADLNKSISPSTNMAYVLLTATQNNAINGDIGGIGALSKAQKAMTWKDLGLLKPVNMVSPTLDGIAGNYQYVEGGAGVTLAPAAGFSDFDSTNFSGGKLEVTISANAESGKDMLSLSGSDVTLSGNTVSVSGIQVGTYSFANNVLTVSFTGANVTADQVSAVTRAVSFSNSSDAPSSVNRTVQFKVTDPEGHASNPALSAVAVLVQPVNDAPTIGTGSALTRTVTSGATYSISNATTSDAVILANGADSRLSVADVDAGSGSVVVTLAVNQGIFELYNGTALVTGSATIDGVAFTGSRTGSLVLSGSLANINAILAGSNTSSFKVLYQPGASAAGSATLSLTVNDRGNTGSGGPQSASVNSVGAITIAAPQTTGTLSGEVTEDVAVAGGNLTATGTLSDSIAGWNFIGNTLGATSALGTLSYSGKAWTYTLGNSSAAVQALVFGQSIEETFEVGTTGTSVFVHVTIHGTDDAPVLTVTDGLSGFTEGGSAATLFSGASATLGGSGASAESGQTISGMTMDVSNVFDGDQIVIDGTRLFLDQSSSGTLTASGYTVSVTYADGSATISITTGQSAPADIETLVTGLAYQSTNRNPTNFGTNTTRTFTILSLTDSGGTELGGSNRASLSLSRSVDVTAVNDAPVLNVAPVTLNQDSTIVLTNAYLLANDPDTVDASLRYTVTGLPGKGTVKVDGVQATHFTQQDITDGKVTYTADPSGSDASDSFTLSVSDGTTSVSMSVDVSIITTNYAPASADSTVTTAEDTPYVFTAADFAFSDFNTGDSMSQLELFTLPGAGKLQAYVDGGWSDVTAGSTLISAAEVSDGHLRFVPAANAYAIPYASFTFKVYDQSSVASDETQLTVWVTPVNDAPVAADASGATNEDLALTGTLPAATDVDHDTVTYSKASDPSHGTLTVDASGGYTYTPNLNYNGSDSFTYTVGDGKGGSNTYTVTLTVAPVNDLPVGADGTGITNEDTPLAGTLPSATDVDNDQIVYTKASDPSNGSVTVNQDGTFTYTPNVNYNGSDSFTFQIDDQKGGTATYTISLTINPVNDAPLASNGSVSTAQGAAVSGSLPAATDAENDVVTYAAGAAPSHGEVVVNGNGTYTYTPAIGFNGNDSFTFTVSDGNGGSNTYSMSVTVGSGNHAPTASNVQVDATEDTTLSSQLPSATDVDGDTVSYALTDAAGHGTVAVNPDGSYTYAPNANFYGSDSFTYTVNDGHGGTATYTVNLTVTPVNDAPADAAQAVTTAEDTSVSFALPTATDVDGDTLTYTAATGPQHGTLTQNDDGTYTYVPAANYNGADTATFTISDGQGGSATYTVNLTVTPGNDAPADAGQAVTTAEDTSVSFTLPTATDVDGDTLTYTAATGPQHGTLTQNDDGSYTYVPAANYNGADTATFTISDGQGGSATYTVNLTVTPVNDAPTDAGQAVTTAEDTSVSFALPTATDVDGDTLTYTAATGPQHGTLTQNDDGSYTYVPAANYNGSDTATFTISDGQGGSATYTVDLTVTPVNDAPTDAGQAVTTAEDTGVSFTLPTATDVDGDTLTYTAATGPQHGTLTQNDDGTYTYVPAANYNGADSATFTISDGQGGSATYTVNLTVTPVNDAPTDAGQAVTTAEDTGVSFTLPTATDVDGDALSYTAATGPQHGTLTQNDDGSYTYVPAANYNGADTATFTISDGQGGSATYTVNLTVTPVNDAPADAGQAVTTAEDTSVSFALPTATDVDGDTLTYTAATGPQHGTLTQNDDGTYTYVPAANYNGADTATFTISDGQGGSATYTVNLTVTPVNDAPADAGQAVTTAEDTSVSFALPTATDVDGDTLTYTAATGPAYGTLTQNDDGSYTYVPAANYNGSDTATFTISDGQGGSATYTVNLTVTPANDAPIAADTTITTFEGAPVSGVLPAATDADNDPVSYAKATDPASGTATVGADGSYTYTPNANYSGTDSFTYTVSDGKGGSNTYAVRILVGSVNHAPVAAPMTAATAEDTALSGFLPIATDADHDAVTYAKATDPANGTVTVGQDGAYTYTPNPNFAGTDSFTFTVSDGAGATSTYQATITVTAVNDAPVAAAASISTAEDIAVSGRLPTATDVENDPVTYSKASDPANGSVTVAADGSYTYTPNADFNGSDSFTYAISDGKGGSASYTVTVNVTPENDAPVAAGISVSTQQGTPVSDRLPLASDPDNDAVSYAKASDPAHGTVSVTADGNFTYSPAAGFNGTDSFSYQVSDGNGGSNVYTVTVGVGAFNHAPVAGNASVTTNEDTAASGMLPAASDADGDQVTYATVTGPAHGSVAIDVGGRYTYTPSTDFNGTDSFTYSVSDGNGGVNDYTVAVTVVPVNDAPVAAGLAIATLEDQPRSGTLPAASDADGDTVVYAKGADPAHGTVVVNGDGTYVYTPAAGFSGSDSFSYQVEDGNGGVNTYAVAVDVGAVNHAPEGSGQDIATNENVPVSGKLPAAADPDGDSISYAAGTAPSHGSVTVGADGAYTYTPAANYHGADAFTYVISDGNGGSASYTVNVSVASVNDAPVATGASLLTPEDTALSGKVPAASDVDGDALSYAIGTGPQHGAVSINADGSFVYRPDANFNGDDSFTYSVNDGHGGTGSATISITVSPVNDAPVAHGGARGAATIGEAMPSVAVPAFTDVDGPTISYSATMADGSALPSWLAFDPSTRTFSGTPPAGSAGSYSVRVTGSDGQLSDSASVDITVQNPPAPQQTVSIGAMSKDTGLSSTDFITADGSAGRAVSGSLSAALGKNEVVQVSFDGGTTWSTASASGTSWSANDGAAHSANWTIVARVTNTIAGLSGAGDSRAVVLDTAAPTAPGVDSQTTSSTAPVITGSAQVGDGETLRVTINGGSYDVVASGGRWSLDLASVSAAPLVPGQSYDVTATITDVAGNSRDASGMVSVSVPVVQKPETPAAPEPSAAPAPVEVSTLPAGTPEPAAGGAPVTPAASGSGGAWGGATTPGASGSGTTSSWSTPPSSVLASSPAFPANPAMPGTSTDSVAAPGSLAGGDALSLTYGQGMRALDTPVELQLTRSAELSDVYTRSEGFRTVVAKAQEPALVLFQGVPDQYLESGTHLSLTVPADAFAHTQPKAIVRLAAQLADGRPLPVWVSFNGQTGQFTGDAPPGMRGELRVKVIARDMDGREAVALFRVNVGEGRVAGEAAKGAAGKPGLSQQLRAAGQRAPGAPQPQPQPQS